MEMKVDRQRIKAERAKRAWSQEHLAEAAGLGLRTIHRIENKGSASLESVKALAAVLELDISDLVLQEHQAIPPQDISKAARWSVGIHAVLKLIAFGAVILDILYARLLTSTQQADLVAPVFAAISDSLLSLAVWVGIALLASLVTTWHIPAVRTLLLVSLGITIGVPLMLVPFVDVTQDVAVAGSLLRIAVNGLTLWLALLAAWKILRQPQPVSV